MKSKSLLLLTLFLSQTTSLWAGRVDTEDEKEESSSGFPRIHVAAPSADELATAQVEVIRGSIAEVIRVTRENAATNTGRKILLLGLTGSGKSTLGNFLAEIPLTADETFSLNTTDPHGFKIGNTAQSMTTIPSAWNRSTGETLWDLAGLGDTRGPSQKIINAFTFREIASEQVKVILAASESSLSDRAEAFLSMLDGITQIFDIEELKRNLILVITKQGLVRGPTPHTRLEKLLNPGQGNVFHLNPAVKELLQHLVENKESLIPYFPAPIAEGEYNLVEPRTQILKSIESREYIENPKVRLQIPPESQILIGTLAEKLIEDVKASLKLRLELKAPFTFSQWAKGYKEQHNLQLLKEGMEELSTAVRILRAGPGEEIESFIPQLRKFYEPGNLEALKASMKTLTFLKSIKENLNIPTASWADIIESALKKGQNTIENLAKGISEGIKRYIEGVVNTEVLNFSASRVRHNEERGNIESLQGILDNVSQTQVNLRDMPDDELANSVQPLERFFEQEASALRQPLGYLTFIQSFQANIVLPREDWVRPLNLSIGQIRQSISMQQQILAAKKEIESLREHHHQQVLERERLEQERIQRETEARRLSEEVEHQRRLQEEGQRLELIRQQQETEQRLLEAERLKNAAEERARLDVASLTKQLEATQRKVDELREAHEKKLAAEAEQQRLEAQKAAQQRLEAQKAEQQRLEAQKAAQQRLEAQKAEQQRLEAQRKSEKRSVSTHYLKKLKEMTEDSSLVMLKALMDEMCVKYPYRGRYGGQLETLDDDVVKADPTEQPFEIFREHKDSEDFRGCGTVHISYSVKYFCELYNCNYSYSKTPQYPTLRPQDSCVIYKKELESANKVIKDHKLTKWMRMIRNMINHIENFQK